MDSLENLDFSDESLAEAARILYAALEPEDSTMAPLGTDTPIGAAPFGTDTPIGVALPGTDTPIGPTGERDHGHDLSLVEAV